MASKRERSELSNERETLIPKRSKPIQEDFTPLYSYPSYDDEDHDASSVGSNQIFDEIIFISDDEAESTPPKSEKSIQSTEFSDSRIQESRGNFSKAVNGVEESEKEGSLTDDFLANATEEERMFWENYLSRMIDNNGNLLGEFSHLDDDLIIPE